MSNEMQMVPVQVVTEVSDRQPQEQPPTNPLVVIHRLLRGRYIWATLLATLLGAAGVYAGMTLVKPLYASRGLINVRQNVAPILYQTELAGMLPAFSSFVETQASYLQSQRVIDQALQNPEWRALGRGLSPKAVSDFTDALTVQVPKGSAMIQVSFVDEDPVAARLAVRAVIQAYRALYGDSETEDIAQRMQILEDRRTALNNQHKSLKDRVQQMAHEYGSAALERMYDHSLKEVQSLETELRRIQLAIAIAEGAQEAIVDAPALPQVDLTASDPKLRELTRQQEDLHREVELLRFRYGDSHTKVSEKAHERLLVEQAIEQRKEELAKQDPAMVFNPEGASLADLRSREQRVSRLYQAAKAETVELGRKNLLIQTLESEADMVQKRLEETNNRIEHLTVESAASGRIEVVSMGDPPLRPEKDKRKQMAAVGGLGGFGFGIGVFLLLGLLNRKMRSIEDARQGLGNTVRLLGTMPTLPNELIDPEDIATAAYCVHQIRGLLQMHKEAADRRVIAITSPTANDGKTTLTLALAISFATARSRVLMIDCDLVGGGLSSRVNRSVHRKIGKILQRRGLLTPE